MYTCILSFIRTIIHSCFLGHIHNPSDIYTGASSSQKSVPDVQLNIAKNVFFTLSFFFSIMSTILAGYRFNLHSAPRPGLQVEGTMTQIQPCKCIPLYHICISHIRFSMPSHVLNITGKKKQQKKNTFDVLATRFWEFSLEIQWVSAPAAQCWGCGCTTLSGTIMRSWFLEDLCGISYMMSAMVTSCIPL